MAWRSVPAEAAALVLVPAVALADHPGPGVAPGMGPLGSAMALGGLALLAGAIVVVVVAVLTRPRDSDHDEASGSDGLR